VTTPDAVPVDIHAGAFDVDEAAIPIGARVLAGMALEAIDALARPLELT
jgi:metal-dependent amidase/aminoacylase/carboxypeptidase family protein